MTALSAMLCISWFLLSVMMYQRLHKLYRLQQARAELTRLVMIEIARKAQSDMRQTHQPRYGKLPVRY